MNSLHKLALVLIYSCALSVLGESQICTIDNWTGTAYKDNGWFAYDIKNSNTVDGAAKINNTTSFLLSPQYVSPVRCIALKVKCSKASPTRQLTVSPFVDGIENEEKNVYVSSLEAENEYEIVKIYFDSSENITAFRLSLSNVASPAAGEWTISQVFVFYGTADENEESVIPEIVNHIKTPENLHVVDFSTTSLSLAADTVAKAIGYRFTLTPFEIENAFEYVEAFTSTPEMSADSGWTRTPETSSGYGSYTGAGTTDGDSKAIKLTGIDAEFLSPICETNICEYSFMYRNGTSATSGLSNTLAVYGRTSADAEWEVLLPEFAFVTDTSKHYITNSVSPSRGIRQIKIAHKAGDNPSKTISLDSLRVASDGEKVASDEITVETESPAYEFTGLAAKWYEFKVQALSDPANEHYTDSEWSEPDSIDLHWANIEILQPDDVAIVSTGEKLTITWAAVDNAEYYLVDVYVPGYPPVYVTQNVETVATKITVTVPELGEYGASVTACGPFGKVKGETSSVSAEVEMGKVEDLEIEDMTPESFIATWNEVAFAEGYDVKVYALSGNATVFKTDYSEMPESLKDSANNAWEMAEYFYGGSGTFNSSRITFHYPSTWIASCEYAEPVTKVEYSFYYAGTPTSAFGVDSILLEGCTGGEWKAIEENTVTEDKQTFSTPVAKSLGFTKIRFTLNTTGSPYALRNVAFGVVNVTCGEITETEVRSSRTAEATYVADSLTTDGRYKLVVSPLPSGEKDLSATIPLIDLSTAHPPVIEAVGLRDLDSGTYLQDFNALAVVTKESDVSLIDLPYWQMFRDGESVEKIKFGKLGGNPSASGIYACCDADLTEESYALGSLASSSIETIYGIAFSNDCESAVQDISIAFKSMQRTFKNGEKTLALEYLVTNETVDVASEGNWQTIEIPTTAPYTAATRGDKTFYEQEIATTVANANIPVGGVVIFRWRDAASAKNPLVSIDDVTIQYTFKLIPTSIFLK